MTNAVPLPAGSCSGLLFDVVAGRAVALMVGCSLQEAVLLSIQQLLLQLERSHYKSKIHIKHLQNYKCNFCLNLFHIVDIWSILDSPCSYIAHFSNALMLRIPQRTDTCECRWSLKLCSILTDFKSLTIIYSLPDYLKN